jgi:kynurenine formamidase
LDTKESFVGLEVMMGLASSRPLCTLAVAVTIGYAQVSAAQPIDLARYRLVDLTHAFAPSTLYWPTSPSGFRLEQLAYGPTPGGYFYSSYAFSTPEHGGTHLDAPIHFAANGITADRVPLEQLVAPAVVIDVSAKAAADPLYRLTPNDVRDFEQRHGRINRGSIVLLRTGWSARWPDRLAYFGDATPGDASKLRFPSYGPEAAELLVRARGVGALGVDVASIDYGPSTDFAVHRIAAAANVPGFENLTRLDELPPTGAVVIALPMKIEGGSGGPLRAIALVPRAGQR